MERTLYTLKHPIVMQVHDGESAKTVTITELSLAPRIKGRHMRAADQARGPVEAKLLILSSLAGISRNEADELDEEDIIAIDELYDAEPTPPLGDGAGLSADGQGTGAPSQQT